MKELIEVIILIIFLLAMFIVVISLYDFLFIKFISKEKALNEIYDIYLTTEDIYLKKYYADEFIRAFEILAENHTMNERLIRAYKDIRLKY